MHSVTNQILSSSTKYELEGERKQLTFEWLNEWRRVRNTENKKKSVFVCTERKNHFIEIVNICTQKRNRQRLCKSEWEKLWLWCFNFNAAVDWLCFNMEFVFQMFLYATSIITVEWLWRIAVAVPLITFLIFS